MKEPKASRWKVLPSALVKAGAWLRGAVVVVVVGALVVDVVVGGSVVVVVVGGSVVVVVVGGSVVDVVLGGVVLVVVVGAAVVVVVAAPPADTALQSFAVWVAPVGTWPAASSTWTMPLPSLAAQIV